MKKSAIWPVSESESQVRCHTLYLLFYGRACCFLTGLRATFILATPYARLALLQRDASPRMHPLSLTCTHVSSNKAAGRVICQVAFPHGAHMQRLLDLAPITKRRRRQFKNWHAVNFHLTRHSEALRTKEKNLHARTMSAPCVFSSSSHSLELHTKHCRRQGVCVMGGARSARFVWLLDSGFDVAI